jgi:hypothetical protein
MPKSADFAASAKKKSAKKNDRPNCNVESLATEFRNVCCAFWVR